MIRFLIGTGIQLLANALGLLVASWLLDDVTLTASGFIWAVVLFTLVYALAQPFLTQLSMNMPALRGGVALVATLVGLIITAWLTDGLTIDGTSTWLLATLIVWLVSLIGVLLLPIVLVKKKVQENRS